MPVPVAAASLGQVYRARYEGPGRGRQGPETKYDMRRRARLVFAGQLGAVRRKRQKDSDTSNGPTTSSSSTRSVRGAYGELDYEHEAANQKRFKDAIAKGPARLYVTSTSRGAAGDAARIDK